jgi:uncharacterized protein (DUF2141 family)
MATKLLWCLTCCIFITITTSIFAQFENFTIEGTISFEEPGDIYIFLVTEQGFKTPLTGLQKVILKIGPDEIQKRKLSFEFKDVRRGTYGIRCFQDVNGNGKLDKGLFGPKEPWGMSWQRQRPSKWPIFGHIAFEVTSDIRDIHIQLK